MEEEIKYHTLPDGLMLKKAWWIKAESWEAFKRGDFVIGDELDRHDLNLLNMGLQSGEQFISLPKELAPGFNVISQINQNDKKIYSFLIDLASPYEKQYEGDTTYKLTITPETLHSPNFIKQLKRMLGFEPDESH